jgi:hypothetical protein
VTASPTATITWTPTPTCFSGPWEQEPNNSYQQANGPLCHGAIIQGYPNDQKDYFSFYAAAAGTMIVDLADHTGQGVQLLLFYQSVENRVGLDQTPPYHIDYAGQAGWYFIYIYTESGFNSTTPYTLTAVFP